MGVAENVSRGLTLLPALSRVTVTRVRSSTGPLGDIHDHWIRPPLAIIGSLFSLRVYNRDGKNSLKDDRRANVRLASDSPAGNSFLERLASDEAERARAHPLFVTGSLWRMRVLEPLTRHGLIALWATADGIISLWNCGQCFDVTSEVSFFWCGHISRVRKRFPSAHRVETFFLCWLTTVCIANELRSLRGAIWPVKSRGIGEDLQSELSWFNYILLFRYFV